MLSNGDYKLFEDFYSEYQICHSKCYNRYVPEPQPA